MRKCLLVSFIDSDTLHHASFEMILTPFLKISFTSEFVVTGVMALA